MCLALYIGSENDLPEIKLREVTKETFQSSKWPAVAQRFYVSTLDEKQQVVRCHFSVPFVYFAGSYEGCSCGFNYGREYPEYEDEKDHLLAAQESVAELVSYIRDHQVKELYACWFDVRVQTKGTDQVDNVAQLRAKGRTVLTGRRLIASVDPQTQSDEP